MWDEEPFDFPQGEPQTCQTPWWGSRSTGWSGVRDGGAEAGVSPQTCWALLVGKQEHRMVEGQRQEC